MRILSVAGIIFTSFLGLSTAFAQGGLTGGTGAMPVADSGQLSLGTGPRHAIAMHGEPKYGSGFRNFDYAEPLATRGGELIIPEIGTFDTLNPLIISGTPAWPIYYYAHDRLMMRSADEAFTLYGLIAETIEVPEDRSWVSFSINPNATFSDGTPLTADDVVFSWETLRTEGRPNMRNFYNRVAEVRRPNERTVQFIFDPAQANRELPLIMGMMPIISQAYYTANTFDESTLTPPVTSGPYMVEEVDAGTRLVLRRNPNYWAASLPSTNGLYNFDRVVHDYYRDRNAAFEAFKSGDVNVWPENDAGRWATAYNFPAARTGRVIRREFLHGRPSGMYSFVFNTRRAVFSDVRVREAITLAFDFDWLNTNLFHGSYVRTQSYWDNSDLGALGPANLGERSLIMQYPGAVRPEMVASGWQPPVGGDRLTLRNNLMGAVVLLEAAGYVVDPSTRTMVNNLTGEPLEFEIMLQHRNEERLALNLRDTLANIGVTVNVRLVDASQFQSRSQTYDYDMMPFRYSGSLSPGNEQSFRYGSREASIDGTYNFAGVNSPAVDAFINAITEARTREELQVATRSLDRTLMSGYYVIPLYYQAVDRISYWGEIDHPEEPPLTGYVSGDRFKHETWWYTADN